jgi:hypothetical protein
MEMREIMDMVEMPIKQRGPMTTIGTKETRFGVWQLTFNRVVLADSEKFLSVSEAENAARREVERNPARYRLHSDVGYGHLAPRFDQSPDEHR